VDCPLYELVKNAKKNNEALNTIIKLFEPKINKSLSLTHYSVREDLSQEIKFKLVKLIKEYDIDSVPSFWEFKENLRKIS